MQPKASSTGRPPPRVRSGAVPAKPARPHPGRFLWTCRSGFEPHLFEELAWAGCAPRLLGPALVEADVKTDLQPAFGRSGFEVLTVWSPSQGADILRGVAAQLQKRSRGRPLLLQAWAPDADPYHRFSPLVDEWTDRLRQALAETFAPEGASLTEQLAQLCLFSPEEAAIGVVAARDAVTQAPGGRLRMRRGGKAPSRAAMKLDEALETLGYGPERGDRCADLGAAPGGWTQRLLERGAKVIAVDPGPLRPDIAAHAKVEHLRESAFRYEPDAPLDWLFCDMAWRPLEVAQLLAKWGRNHWADALCANFKLPMRDKNPILFRIRHLLEESGWMRLRIRQLYHDRDEVTVTAGLR
jgi:23S rRNA (cytidine2498-2'-O)-methyltransferase